MATRLRISLLLLLLASPFFTGGCRDVCQECLPISPLPHKLCLEGLVCVNNRCSRPAGNLPGECCTDDLYPGCQGDSFCANNTQCQRPEGNLEGEHCSDDGASCNPELFCLYQTCEASPIYPAPKEISFQTTDQFLLNEDTLVILPENPSNTDEKAGELLHDQIVASCGINISMRTYIEGDPPENAIVIGSPNSNPAVVTLLQNNGLQIPGEGPVPLENYALKVVPSHIVAAGAGDPGVLHAAQVLKQYIRGVTSMTLNDSLPVITVRDYPDAGQRAFVMIFAHYHFPADVGEGNTDGYKYMDLPFTIDTARAYLHILSELRFNTVFLKMADIVAWDNIPQPENTAISVQDFLGLVQEANEYGLETIPLLNASSAHYGWIGTVDEPADFTEEYVLSHNAEHLAIYLALVGEIIQAYESVQPLRFFHAGMDEDWSFGSRPTDLHLQWVDEIYSEVISHGKKMMIWYDNWTATQHFLTYGQNYPDMRVLVWDYETPIQNTAKIAVENALARGLETEFTFWGNGVLSDFEWWFSLQNPLQKGFIGINWVLGTACKEQTNSVFEETVNTYIRKHANQFWNAEHLE